MSKSSEEARQWANLTEDNEDQRLWMMEELYLAIEHETTEERQHGS